MAVALVVVLGQCSSPPSPESAPAKTIVARDTAAMVADTVTRMAAVHIPLTVVVDNLASPSAPVVVGVYQSNYEFPNPKGRFKVYHLIPHGDTLTADIHDLKYGEYALAIYQDINSNSEMDKNLIGFPKERYAFSNNFKVSVKLPVYDQCKFQYDAVHHSVSMRLIKAMQMGK
ncbi:MAG: DUF2141 domain-containing protein [Flavobacteriales bacterium]